MNWTKITVYTSSDGIDPVLGILTDLGIEGTEISDETEFKTFLEENRAAWDYVDDELLREMSEETRVSFYLEKEDPALIASLKSELSTLKAWDGNNEFGRLEISTAKLEDEDWLNNWKQYFHTFEIGERLIIKPYWENVNADGKKVFEINPGLSFGTGTHHTTRMCLEDIIGIIETGDCVLDLGAGSGILSIVSMLFGAKEAFSVDIDENAEKTIGENLERNGIDGKSYHIMIGNVLTDEKIKNKILERKYDAVFANIVADVIIQILPFVRECLKKDGHFIASGIISERAEEVKNSLLSQGFEIISERRSGDWAEYLCRLG